MVSENNYTDKQIGNYRIISKLASGAFGTVYLGKHAIFTKRPVVAIKLLHAHLDSQEERDRFLQEAQWLEMLEHPHILPIIDAGIHEGFPYLVTEYAQNGSLHECIKRLSSKPLPTQECLNILSQVEQALQCAHEQNIIHRDLTPGNILFNAKGEVLLADFGVATMLATASIKQTTNPIGTPPYMAPEQFKGEISKEIDQYALGCIAYELFTGQRPFTGSAAELMYKHINVVPIPPRQLNPNLPEHIEQAILKAMQKKRADRYIDVSAFVEALKNESKPQPVNNINSNDQQLQSFPTEFVNPVQPNSLPQATLDPLNTQPLPPETVDPLQQSPLTPPITTPEISKTAKAGAARVAQGVRKPAHTSSTNSIFPINNNLGSGSITSSQRWSWPRGFITLALVLLITLVIFGGIALAAPGTFAFLSYFAFGPVGGGTRLNAVTITPISADLHNTYVFTGVTTGTPDSSKRQVQARILTSVTETVSKTVAATDLLSIPATQATGTLTFYNGNGIDEVVQASAFAVAVNGVQIKLTADVDIPAAPAAGVFGVKNAAAFADPPGANGNIPAGTINQYCCGNSAISVKNNTAFSGGKDATTETIVQQSDINNAATPLENSLKQAALASSNLKIQPGEQYLPNQPQCNTAVTSDHTAGQQAQNVTVTVKVTCSAEVYDQRGAQALAANLLKSEAVKAAGPGYALTGSVVSTVKHATVGSPGGTVTLFVKAEGIWVYQFSTAQKAQLAQLITGKSQSDANTLLSQQPGVDKVNSITLSGGTTLPTDPKQITILVESIPGLRGTPAGTPTFTTSPVLLPSPSVVPGK